MANTQQMMAALITPGRSPGADTLGAGVSPSHSAPGVWLPGCSPSRSGSALQPKTSDLDSAGRRGASGHDVPSQEWESGDVLGRGAGLWGRHAWDFHAPVPAAQSLTGWAGPHGGWETHCGGCRAASGPWQLCAHTESSVYTLTNTPIALHAHSDTATLTCILTSTPAWPLFTYIH